MNEKEIAEKVASNLLKIKAVFLKPNDPFTWASGIKSPIYCDNRLTLSYPEVREVVEEGLKKTILAYFPDVEILEGTSTAGIAHAAIVATKMNLPMGYVRSGHKDHGRGNQIEGISPKGKKVVVVEDLISTGGSSLEVVDILREEGAEVLGIVSIFTYNLAKGKEKLEADHCINHSLSNFETLISIAKKEEYIKEEDIEKLLKFQSNPSDPTWMDAGK